MMIMVDVSRCGWEKGSVTVRLETGATIWSAVLWQTGELELERGDTATGGISRHHLDLHHPARALRNRPKR